MTSAPQLRGISPVFLVADVAKAAAYYADALGFRVPQMWGEPPHFCIAERDGIEIMLNQLGEGEQVVPNSSYDGRFDAYLSVTDADALFAEFAEKGAEVVCAPEDQPYGMREFQVRDPDGHLVAFGHSLPGMGSA
jgi:uncharacterized glyoxalase superfamily protein PhnB